MFAEITQVSETQTYLRGSISGDASNQTSNNCQENSVGSLWLSLARRRMFFSQTKNKIFFKDWIRFFNHNLSINSAVAETCHDSYNIHDSCTFFPLTYNVHEHRKVLKYISLEQHCNTALVQKSYTSCIQSTESWTFRT